MSTLTFTHLHLHTEYSLCDSIIQIDTLMEELSKKGMKSAALTDRMNLFSAVKFYRAALAAKIKPIIGAEIVLREEKEGPDLLCVMLCQNAKGYLHLTRLLSKAYVENQDSRGPWIKYEWLEHYAEGLIVLSGGLQGDIAQAFLKNDKAGAIDRLLKWRALFPNRFYLEIQRLHKPGEEDYIAEILQMAEEHEVPVVATNNVRFLDKEDFEAHEARVCIHEGTTLGDPRRPKRYTSEQYLKTFAEMEKLFEEVPEALENTVEITKRCNLHLQLGETHLPHFPVPENMTVEEFLTQMAKNGLEERLQHYSSSELDRTIYDNRLQMELEIIHRMGFSGYFLIVADFIQWAKNNQIPVGPGRGSGVGSLVAYALKITDLDPILHDLLFERFLNPERVSMPDFDVDFCVEGRDRVIEYVAQKYGRENVAQIITYGTMAAKAVVRDTGRVLGHPYGFVDQIAKLIPFELGMTLDKALKQEAELGRRYEEEEEVKLLLDLAKKLEGITRNVGKHAGGVVIAPSALTDFTALYCEAGEHNTVTQFDKDDIETVGLVKFDFLGLTTLTIIQHAVKTINRRLEKTGQPLLTIERIPIDDFKTFELLRACQTTAIFQLESRGMREILHRLQLDCFDDIMALVALYRPGPLQSGMVDDFVDRKRGKTAVIYPHPSLESILKPTCGAILYQEQVMQIAQVLAGYSLGEADILRRAMGKKKAEEMAKQRQRFIDGSVEREVEKDLAAHIFDLMEKFAGYGFNKSHAAAYALISYQTAWLKAHYPAEFMAAVLSADMSNTDKVRDFIEECRAMAITVNPPNIHQGEYVFTVNEGGEIVYGLGAVKGVGQSALETILIEREKRGHFKNLFEFCQRVELKKVNRKVLEALICAGALDVWDVDRAILFGNIDKAIKLAEQKENNQLQGQQDLFHLLDGPLVEAEEAYLTVLPWRQKEKLQLEKEKLGFYMTGHPFEGYRKECGYFISDNLRSLDPRKSSRVTIAGLVIDIKKILTKQNKRMAIVNLDDGFDKIEITLFSEILENNQSKLNKDIILVAEGEIAMDAYTEKPRMRAEKIMTMQEARECFSRGILLTVDESKIHEKDIKICKEIIEQYQGGRCPVQMTYQKPDMTVLVNPGSRYHVHPEDDLIEQLNGVQGISAVIHYG